MSIALAMPPFKKYRSKFGGMDSSMVVDFIELKDEKNRLKKLYA
ncbi:hypothetical protein [Halomonas sp. CSM-2]|nr:hypothetical protein [Halomonas sp. CSM-2]